MYHGLLLDLQFWESAAGRRRGVSELGATRRMCVFCFSRMRSEGFPFISGGLGVEAVFACRSEVLLRKVDQKKCRSEVLLRSVDQKKCGSEVLIRCRSTVSIRSINQKCCSEKSIRKSVPQKCCSEVSVRKRAVQKC